MYCAYFWLNEIKAGALVNFSRVFLVWHLFRNRQCWLCFIWNDREVKEGDRVEGTSSIVDISVGFGLLVELLML